MLTNWSFEPDWVNKETHTVPRGIKHYNKMHCNFTTKIEGPESALFFYKKVLLHWKRLYYVLHSLCYYEKTLVESKLLKTHQTSEEKVVTAETPTKIYNGKFLLLTILITIYWLLSTHTRKSVITFHFQKGYYKTKITPYNSKSRKLSLEGLITA